MVLDTILSWPLPHGRRLICKRYSCANFGSAVVLASSFVPASVSPSILFTSSVGNVGKYIPGVGIYFFCSAVTSVGVCYVGTDVPVVQLSHPLPFYRLFFIKSCPVFCGE